VFYLLSFEVWGNAEGVLPALCCCHFTWQAAITVIKQAKRNFDWEPPISRQSPLSSDVLVDLFSKYFKSATVLPNYVSQGSGVIKQAVILESIAYD
jgi:hypothetical protein